MKEGYKFSVNFKVSARLLCDFAVRTSCLCKLNKFICMLHWTVSTSQL